MGILTAEGSTVAALLSIRFGGLVLTAPVLSTRTVPGHLKAASVVLLTLLLWPVAVVYRMPGVRLDATTFLTEAVVGVTLGLAATLFIAGAEAAGDMLAVQMGLSGANVLDPLSHTQMPVLGQLMGLFALALMLSVGGHLVLFEALAASLEFVPVGGELDPGGHVAGAVEIGSTLFLLGLRFAAPVVGVMMIGNAALGVLAKTVPQLNVLMVAFPLQIALGLFALSVTVPLIATFFLDWPDLYTALAGSILEGLALPGGR